MLWRENNGREISVGERVLVVIVPTLRDWSLIREAGWYRIPVSRAPKRLAADYLAFYHPKCFGPLRWSIAYYARVMRYRVVRRCELLPEQADHPRAQELYYRIDLGPLHALPHPGPSIRLRRVTFIPTTLERLFQARAIGELWIREPLPARLGRALDVREAAPLCSRFIGCEKRLHYSARIAGT